MTDRARRDFPEFVAARGAALQRAAYLMVGDPGLAQDLTQEALIKTYVAWPRLRDPGNLANAEAYTRRAITTIAISWMRRRSWRAEQTADHLPERATADHAEAIGTSTDLWSALQALPARQRVAVVLRVHADEHLRIGETP